MELQEFLKKTVINKVCVVLKKESSKQYTVSEIRLPQSSANYKFLMSIEKGDSVWGEFRFKNYNSEQIHKLYKRAVRMDKPTRPIKQKKVDEFFDEGFTVRKR
jgi:hypothetical protein